MQSRWFHRPHLHSPALGLEKRASWLEFFYDLVFVAAFILLGNGLSEQVTPRGLGLFAGAFVPLWVAWTGFTFYENRFSVDDFLHRTLVLLQMMAVGGMAVGAAGLLRGETVGFAASASVAQLLVAAMYLRAYLQVPEARAYSRYWGSVFAVAGAAWGLAAVLPHAHAALALSGLATAVVLLSPLSKQSRALMLELPLDFEHLGERYGLLTIIVLGESFVKVLSALVQSSHGPDVYVEGSLVLLLTAGLWWVYFDDVAGSRIREGHGQWIVWLYAHLPLQIAITAAGVALEKAVHFDWSEPARDAYRFLLTGALGLAYLSVAAIDSVTERRQAELNDRARVNARAASGLLLLLLGAGGRTLPAGVLISLVTAINVAQVAFDMMMAPFGESAHSEIGARTTAEIARERRAGGESAAPPRRVDIGRAVRKGTPSELRRDLYFYFIEGSWWRLGAVFTLLFLATNLLFASLYAVEPGSILGADASSFADAFFFSVQTMSTIGYGAMSPASPYADAVVTVEAAVSLVGVAILTGIAFAKLSRPKAGVLFSEPLVLTTMNGQRVLTFRVGNIRGNEVVDASMTFTLLREELTPEGHHLRRLHELPLSRSRTPLFTLTWTAMHVIDEASPLRDVDWSHPGPELIGFTATVIGHDGTYGQTAYARHTYYCDDLRVGHRFVDILSELGDGRLMVDYGKFHDTVPEPPPAGAPASSPTGA